MTVILMLMVIITTEIIITIRIIIFLTKNKITRNLIFQKIILYFLKQFFAGNQSSIFRLKVYAQYF